MGKPKHSDDPRGEQKGAVERDVNDHGEKTYEARKAAISDHGQERGGQQGRSERAANDPQADGTDADEHEHLIAESPSDADGGHRLFENRTQHDPAEKNSERNRRDVDVQRHHHDRDEFQGQGQRPEDTPSGAANVKNTGKGGGNRSDEDRGGK